MAGFFRLRPERLQKGGCVFLFDPVKHLDPMLVLERLYVELDSADQQAALAEYDRSFKDRKAVGLCLMGREAIPVPKRYRFFFYRTLYRRPFRTDEMKRREATPKGEVATAAVSDPNFEKKFPKVWEYMTRLHFDDGEPRQLSKVSLFVENGKFKAALNDPEERASLYVAADTVDAVLKALEATLASENPEWRPWNGNTKKK